MLGRIRQMASELYTRERLGELSAQLKTYRNERFEAGDKKTAELAHAASIYVKDEDEPGCNCFLCTLIYLSLLKTVQTAASQAEEEEPS